MKHRNLASERVRIGLTQAQMAEKLGCTVKSLSAYETNERPLPTELAFAAADIFGCTIAYLFDRTNERA